MRVSFPSDRSWDQGSLLKHMAESVKDTLKADSKWIARSASWADYLTTAIASWMHRDS